jgi:hypothetical protein
MTMPGRKYQASPTSKYRYSINGQEKESELNENITTAEYWEYDSRIVRRWNTDPVVKAEESPYMCFSGNPIWLSDPNGDTPGDSIKHRIIDNHGNEITKPTVIDLSCYNARGVPGMKCVGDNRVEVTPGTYSMPDRNNNSVSLVNTFIQNPTDADGGNKYTWNPGSPPTSPTEPPPPPIVAAQPTLQYNNQITAATAVRGVIGQMNANLANQNWVITGLGNTFINPAAANAAIGAYARQLRGFGITTTNLTIGTSLASATTPDNIPGRNGAGVIRDRAATVSGILGSFGVRVGTVNAIYGQRPPALTAQTNANQVGIRGWNVTTQAMQRQILRGNVVPGSVQPVQGQNPVGPIFQRNTGGAAPRSGNYTGRWRPTL